MFSSTLHLSAGVQVLRSVQMIYVLLACGIPRVYCPRDKMRDYCEASIQYLVKRSYLVRQKQYSLHYTESILC